MVDKTYKLTLDNGTVINGLRYRNAGYISKTPFPDGLFSNSVFSVEVTDGETVENYSNMELRQTIKQENGWRLILRPVKAERLEHDQMLSDISYLTLTLDPEAASKKYTVFKNITNFYDKGVWTEARLSKAVDNGWITIEQAEEIRVGKISRERKNKEINNG